MIPGLGPVRISRLIEAFGSAGDVLDTSESSLQRVKGIGPSAAKTIIAHRAGSLTAAMEELAFAESLNVELIPLGDVRYPTLLHAIPNPPPILYLRGELHPQLDRYTVAIVGSRACTPYGIEQAERFAGFLASSGLTIVSGGARGIDTAAHRAALRHQGRTIAILGCGLATCFPPENSELFDEIADGRGAVLSELPLRTHPAPENFPMRNRIISGLSLGTLVIEAASGSGALITTRLAAEEHGREVMGIPGRIDSPASEGVNELLKSGGAALVADPADVLDLLETPARHLHRGAHEARYTDPSRAPEELFAANGHETAIPAADADRAVADSLLLRSLNEIQRDIVEALAEPLTLDELSRATSLDAATLRTEVTLLEMKHVIERSGGSFRRRETR